MIDRLLYPSNRRVYRTGTERDRDDRYCLAFSQISRAEAESTRPDRRGINKKSTENVEVQQDASAASASKDVEPAKRDNRDADADHNKARAAD